MRSGSCEEEYATALVVVAGGGEVVLIVGVELSKGTVFRLMVSGSCLFLLLPSLSWWFLWVASIATST